jgi:hypothetical protein
MNIFLNSFNRISVFSTYFEEDIYVFSIIQRILFSTDTSRSMILIFMFYETLFTMLILKVGPIFQGVFDISSII